MTGSCRELLVVFLIVQSTLARRHHHHHHVDHDDDAGDDGDNDNEEDDNDKDSWPESIDYDEDVTRNYRGYVVQLFFVLIVLHFNCTSLQ